MDNATRNSLGSSWVYLVLGFITLLCQLQYNGFGGSQAFEADQTVITDALATYKALSLSLFSQEAS